MDGEQITHLDLEALYQDFDKNIRVDETYIENFRISTVLLGINYNPGIFSGEPPIIFETMIFDKHEISKLDGSIFRYSSKEEAKEGHKKVCELVNQEINRNRSEKNFSADFLKENEKDEKEKNEH